MLIRNKYDQHSDLVYLVENEFEKDPGVDNDIENDDTKGSPSPIEAQDGSLTDLKILDEYEDPIKNHCTEIKAKLHKELREYFKSHPAQWKILVTYDSFRVLKEVLEEMGVFLSFYVVVDEMQAIMGDARFKSSTEINFLYHLRNSPRAIYVSATPMLEEYLDELEDFKNLPYFEFDWKTEDLSRITKPDLEVRRMNSSIRSIIKNIITDYREGKFDSVDVYDNGQLKKVYATELVFYLNSVSSIISIIKSCGLSDQEVNILCSKNPDNQKKIWKKLGEKNGYKIGRVPIKGEPRKPFTFCTRTVYLGADFYSDCAKSYIFSDANSKYLSIDISQDLPQILGRQRCDENPWKNSAVLYYKLTDATKRVSKEVFDEKINKKKKDTLNLLEAWETAASDSIKDSLSKKYISDIRSNHYSNDYVSVNREEVIDPVTKKKYYRLVPSENHLVRVSEKRAFDIQQVDYADRFSVFSAIHSELGNFSYGSSDQNPIEFQVTEFYRVYDTLTKISDKLRLLCEIPATSEALRVILAQLPDTDKVKLFYTSVGPEVCKASGYIPSRIEVATGIKFYSKDTLRSEIYSVYSEGQKISLSDIKSGLSDIYSKIKYQKTPKATDMKEYFDIKPCKIPNSDGKWVNGYELLRRFNP